MLEDFRSRPSVQIAWFKNRRNLLQGTKIVDRNQIFRNTASPIKKYYWNNVLMFIMRTNQYYYWRILFERHWRVLTKLVRCSRSHVVDVVTGTHQIKGIVSDAQLTAHMFRSKYALIFGVGSGCLTTNNCSHIRLELHGQITLVFHNINYKQNKSCSIFILLFL
jgi:hypothetical protein